MLKHVLAPLAPEDFFRDYWTRKFLHISGQPDKFNNFYSWEVLNKALEEHRFDATRLMLYKSGTKIEPGRYLHRYQVNSGKLINELTNGATLIFNRCEETWPPLRDLCIDLESLFHHPVNVNLYAGWRRDNGFNVHWDEQDTLILHLAGRKCWRVWNPTRLHPLWDDPADAPADEPIWEGELAPGGLMSIPRGWWHVAYPMDDPCLHLTVTVQNLTGIDLLRWLTDRMKSSVAARMALPIMATPEERASWLEQVRSDLLALWDETLVDRYLAEVDSKAMPRPRISLPVEADPRRNGIRETTLLELAVPRPLQFSIQDGRAICHAIGMNWSMDSNVAEKLRLFNDRQPHATLELSAEPDLPLTAVIEVLVTNGVLRRVADSQNRGNCNQTAIIT